MKKVVIVIPTYNEAGSIEKLIHSVIEETAKLSGWKTDILIVDSNSPDKTADIVIHLQKKFRTLYLLKTAREGLGKAYINGFLYATKKLKPDVIFEMDGDLSHNPKSIPLFLNKIDQGADFVIGSRYIRGGSIPSDWGLHRKLFSVLGNIIVRFGLMKLRVTDWTSGFRAIKRWIIQETIPSLTNYSGYVFQVALLEKALRSGARVEEVPINFIDRKHGSSKINSIQYIIQTLLYVLIKSSFVKYVIVGVLGFIIDFGLSFIFIEKVGTAIWAATLISTESAIISNFLLNNFWSFSHKKIPHRFSSYFQKFAKFNVVATGSILIQTLGIELSARVFGRKFWYIYKILIIIFVIIPYSYLLYNKVIWKDQNRAS